MFVDVPKERLPSIASMVVGLALLAGMVGSWSGLASGPKLQIHLPIATVNTPTEEFVTALARGDEATAEQVASPLYRAEWTRRGVSLRDRIALSRTAADSSVSDGEKLQFTPIGRVGANQGFRQLLYLVRPANADPAAPSSVWRIDADSRGQVIWAEMVYLLDPASAPFAPVGPGDAPKGINLADGFPGLDPQVVMGVRSATGREAYYAVRITNPAVQKTQGGVSTAIVYFGVDNEGVIRPGVWSYAQSITSVSPYGQEPRSPIVIFDPETDALRQNYLSVLGG